jgi:hypothetical protein
VQVSICVSMNETARMEAVEREQEKEYTLSEMASDSSMIQEN